MKKLMATITLMGILIVGVSTAKAGFLVSDFAPRNPQPCTEKSNGGIIVTGLTGIIVTGFTGIIITDGVAADQSGDELCGILLSD
jgi:hypothetical protein